MSSPSDRELVIGTDVNLSNTAVIVTAHVGLEARSFYELTILTTITKRFKG